MDCEYTMDFVLPIGPTGPQGEVGATGPAGPSALMALAYAEYTTTSDSGALKMSNSRILPTSTKAFSIQNPSIIINEKGIFEFTICGIINGLDQNEDVNLKVQITSADSTSIEFEVAHFTATVKDIYFSQTFIYALEANQTVQVLFQKNIPSNSVANTTSLIVKQLGF